MPKPVLYLASPYSHPDPEVQHLRYLATRDTVASILREGTFVYSPIVHCHWMAVHNGPPHDINFWREYNFSMIEFLPRFGILKLPGWLNSKGIEEEKAFALTLGRTVESVFSLGVYSLVLTNHADANT